ncbi:ATP-binding protein [Geotalea sp. SG265]|uniref:sensor histidine kinase n=1 Tax=Geotalea sp. SG265 TaxID=2922867 RepID=UPI001FAFDBF6|nr:ATP-binding protein [Geotalea sp. SG265]
MRPFRISLTVSILSSLACLLILTWLLLSLISFKTAEKDLLHQKNDEGRILLAAFVDVLPTSLGNLPGDTIIRNFSARLAKEKDFAGIHVVDAGGRTIYSAGDFRNSDRQLQETLATGRATYAYSRDGRFIYRYAPIEAANKITGAARLTISLKRAQERLAGSRRMFVAYFVLDFLLLLGIGSFMLSRIVVVPVRKLLTATARIASGDYRHTVKVPGSAEIAELAESFNTMAEVLEQKRLEVERTVQYLEQANRDLQTAREESIRSEKMASVGLLAAGTAHEVGTPLAAIIGYAGILKDELKDDDVKTDYVNRIEAEASRIDRIVRGLLDYARPTQSQREQVDVPRLVNDTVGLLQEQGVLKRLNLSIASGGDLPCVEVDPHQLQQVLINLVINARDAMAAGGSLEIRTELVLGDVAPLLKQDSGGGIVGRRKGDGNNAFRGGKLISQCLNGWVTISVLDTGEGIVAEHLEKIFDPFFTTKEPGKGTGLGLAICARIIDSFNGRIVAESETGKGTAVTVWLPVPER